MSGCPLENEHVSWSASCNMATAQDGARCLTLQIGIEPPKAISLPQTFPSDLHKVTCHSVALSKAGTSSHR